MHVRIRTNHIHEGEKMLVDPREVLADAEKRVYAIAGVNTTTFDAAMGVLAAAEELNWPVMIGLAEVHEEYAPIDMLGPMLRDVAVRSKAPVILHLDHGRTMDYVMKAIRYGFTSIMYDCSDLPLDENASRLREFTGLVRELGIMVEAEVGQMPSTITGNSGCVENGVSAEGDISRYFSAPEDVAYFVEKSGVDTMAISFGNVHGEYIGEPKLDIPRLRKIHAVAKCHLVMHGTTGVDDAQIIQAINGGIRKFNYFTGIATAPAKSVAGLLAGGRSPIYIQEIGHCCREVVKEEAKRIITLFRNGK